MYHDLSNDTKECYYNWFVTATIMLINPLTYYDVVYVPSSNERTIHC